MRIVISTKFVVLAAILIAVALVLAHQGHAAAGFKIGGG